ncbi:hypothetical protein H5410_053356 [Solanum commersonii]|uniref:Uncharacterized protein n=1 Tax=Solanum commersonii TaxID=4109 RepID=A0A9J5X3A0_SOLCO|nr:hypothetical protein H5410_053356 [Solanum commersonii]
MYDSCTSLAFFINYVSGRKSLDYIWFVYLDVCLLNLMNLRNVAPLTCILYILVLTSDSLWRIPILFAIQATVFCLTEETFALGIWLGDAVDASNHGFLHLSRIVVIYSSYYI